jgi:hypothetical protein
MELKHMEINAKKRPYVKKKSSAAGRERRTGSRAQRGYRPQAYYNYHIVVVN